MLKALLLALIAFVAVILAVKLIYALALLMVVIVSAIVRGVVVPLLKGVWLFILRPTLWLVREVMLLPFRLIGVIVQPLLPACCASPAAPAGALAGPAAAYTLAPVSGLSLGAVCRNASCRCGNPTGARYCRRCGATLA